MIGELTSDERSRLLALARASVAEEVLGAPRVERLLERTELSAALESPRGAFVSLKRATGAERGGLRGCIGSMTPRGPLYRTVIDVAAKAASADPRFPPVDSKELSSLALELSVLSPLTEVAGPEQVRPGVHGVQLTKGSSRAVFLPQVAAERGWGVKELLSNLAVKAGLPAHGWTGARFEVFTAEVFGDRTMDL